MKITIIPGTFDPPHICHLAMGHMALWSSEADNVWFLPCWQHAFGKNPSSFEHRVNMLQLMIKGSSMYSSRMGVCEDEKEIQSTYSIDILTHIVNKYPDHEFSLVMGSDNYFKVADWKNFEGIRKLVKVLWVARQGEANMPPSEKLIGYNNQAFSSTDARKMIATKDPKVYEFVNKGVIEYAENNNLYK
jgi:nicotinate-nucleotide adenylyltransferase